VGFSRLIVEITHWVTLSNFIPLGGNPNDLGLSWRDAISCHTHKLKPTLILCIYHKNEKGKPWKKDLPLLKNDITKILVL